MIRRCLVIGSSGAVGRLLSHSLHTSGVHVSGVDLKRGADTPCDEFFEENAAAPGEDVRAQLAATDAVFFCLPEEHGLSIASDLMPVVPAGALWVDTFSVKQPIASQLAQYCGRLQILSINPMFSPSLGWRGKPVAAVELAGGVRVEEFKNLLRSWGATIELLSALDHDRATAAIQVATHAAVLAFGAALVNLNYDVEAAVRLATPPHRLLLALLYRIISQNPEVYWEIQHDHPLGSTVRTALMVSIQRLDQRVAKNDKAGFFSEFRSIGDALLAEEPQIAGWTRLLLERVIS